MTFVTAVVLAACSTAIAGQAGPLPSVAAPSTTTGPITDPGTGPSPTADSSAGTSGSPAVLGPIDGPIGRPTPGGKGAGVIPAGLDEFYHQKLDWQSCAPFNTNKAYAEYFAAPAVQCANLIMPLSYAKPAGPTVTMAVIRAEATGPDRVGALQINPGGPGVSGLLTVATMVGDGRSDTLHRSFDFVGFDTRGLGASRPLVSCNTNAERDAIRASTPRTNTPAAIAATIAGKKDMVQRCFDRTGSDAGINGTDFLAAIGTDSTVKDMDVLRSVLGEEKLTYLGYSYGTRLGYVYADQFTPNVRAMILDGAIDPKADPVKEDTAQAVGFQGAFDAFAKDCARLGSCILGDDPTKATAVFQALTRPLLDAPVKLTDGRVLTYADAITGTLLPLYSDSSWPLLRTALTDLSAGNGDRLMALADFYYGRDQAGRYINTQDVFDAVRCVDNPQPDPASTDATPAKNFAAAAPFMDSGDPIVAIPDACALWKVPLTLSRNPLTVDGLAPVVVISTTGDPATPFAAGVALADQLKASLITVQGTRHTAFLSAEIPCVDDAGTAYLVKLTLPATGLTCP